MIPSDYSKRISIRLVKRYEESHHTCCQKTVPIANRSVVSVLAQDKISRPNSKLWSCKTLSPIHSDVLCLKFANPDSLYGLLPDPNPYQQPPTSYPWTSVGCLFNFNHHSSTHMLATVGDWRLTLKLLRGEEQVKRIVDEVATTSCYQPAPSTFCDARIFWVGAMIAFFGWFNFALGGHYTNFSKKMIHTFQTTNQIFLICGNR